jgi:hypothetical protein
LVEDWERNKYSTVNHAGRPISCPAPAAREFTVEVKPIVTTVFVMERDEKTLEHQAALRVRRCAIDLVRIK